MALERKRSVRRVLVMLDYGDGTDGEVFDLTAVALEMKEKGDRYSARVELEVRSETETDYSQSPAARTHKHSISWSGYAGEFVHGASHLEDVVNAAMPDGERVQSIKARIKRLHKKAEDLAHDAMLAKLEQVAAIRHQRPIARVDMSALPPAPEPVASTDA